MFFRNQKRAERRMKRDFPARVLLDGFAKRDCRIVDISESGARLAISGKTELPSRFSIAFASTARPWSLDSFQTLGAGSIPSARNRSSSAMQI
jgi:PilZ domain